MPGFYKQADITSEKDILVMYNEVSTIYYKDGYKDYPLISEWMCLLSTLRKNIFYHILPDLLNFPYTIIKHERPDFLIVDEDKETGIEITKITTPRNEALRNELEKANDDLFGEVTQDIFTDEIPLKGEMKKNLIGPDDELSGSPILGWYAEKQWAKACIKAILIKDRKEYDKPIYILLLDDTAWPISYYIAMLRRNEEIKKLIEICPCFVHGIKVPTIISNSNSAIEIIRYKHEWKFSLTKTEPWAIRRLVTKFLDSLKDDE